ncbi:MAG: hypothetical protein J7L15_08185 [Clostridiales bacterium]|nr:hypothetical protein [Clostridiales bacterium]
MSREDRKKLQNMLCNMTIQELSSCFEEPCVGYEKDTCRSSRYICGHYESKEGITFGPVQVKAELIKRQRLIDLILKRS